MAIVNFACRLDRHEVCRARVTFRCLGGGRFVNRISVYGISLRCSENVRHPAPLNVFIIRKANNNAVVSSSDRSLNNWFNIMLQCVRGFVAFQQLVDRSVAFDQTDLQRIMTLTNTCNGISKDQHSQ
jgi:hypothetical protein